MTDECNHEQTEMTIVGDSDDYPGFELKGRCLCCGASLYKDVPGTELEVRQ
jgi:hypothetical protein